MTEINSIADLAAAIGTPHNTIESISRAIYKGTDCGAWVNERHNGTVLGGVAIGSIVEGVDQETEVYELEFPFAIEEFWNAVQAVENEAAQIWQDTHGCEDCGEEDPETGYRAINPDCPTCKGQGEIL